MLGARDLAIYLPVCSQKLMVTIKIRGFLVVHIPLRGIFTASLSAQMSYFFVHLLSNSVRVETIPV